MTKPVSKLSASTASASATGSAAAVGRALTSLPPEHSFYANIGRVAAEWARLEHILDLIIWELSGLNQTEGSCITGVLLGHLARFNAILALASSKGFSKELLNRIKARSDRTGEVAKRRHRFVHDAWYTEGGDHAAQFRSFSAKDGKFGIHDVTAADAHETIEAIQEEVRKVETLRNEIQRLL